HLRQAGRQDARRGDAQGGSAEPRVGRGGAPVNPSPGRGDAVDVESLERFLNEPALHEQIIGSFCHDLRQPLQSALMRLAALKRADEHGQNREVLEDLYLSLREIATMSETVFDTIRLSRATIASQHKAVAVDELIRRVEA